MLDQSFSGFHQGRSVSARGRDSSASFGEGIHQTIRPPVNQRESGSSVRRGVADGSDREVRRDLLPEAALHHLGHIAVKRGYDGVPYAGQRLVM